LTGRCCSDGLDDRLRRGSIEKSPPDNEAIQLRWECQEHVRVSEVRRRDKMREETALGGSG